MRKYLFAAAAVAAIASPASARDGAAYFGIEGGILFPKDQDGDLDATFTQSAQAPVAGTPATLPGTGVVGAVAGPPAALSGDLDLDYKKGFDIDAVAGYDFGMFRIEGELGYKRAKFDNVEIDDAFVTGLEGGLNPTGTTGTAFVLDDEDFDLNDRVSVLSGMVNALLDFGNDDGLSFYGGGGFGRARVKMFGESDSA